MKVHVFSLALLATMWLSVTDAWISIHIGKRGLAKDCPFNCQRYCPDSSCSVICANQCVLRDQAVKDKHIKPFPHQFKTYDKNGDGFISVSEMTKALKADTESTEAALTLADDNRDGKLSKKEFDEAPYHKPQPGEKPKAERDFEEWDLDPYDEE